MCVMIHALCSETRTLERPLLFEIRSYVRFMPLSSFVHGVSKK